MPNYKFSESSFENAVIDLFIEHDYSYDCGYDIHRTNQEVLLVDDFKAYVSKRYSALNLQDDEIDAILNNLLYTKGASLYATMKLTLKELRAGFMLDRSSYNQPNELIEYLIMTTKEIMFLKLLINLRQRAMLFVGLTLLCLLTAFPYR